MGQHREGRVSWVGYIAMYGEFWVVIIFINVYIVFYIFFCLCCNFFRATAVIIA